MATKAASKRLGKEAQMMDRDPPPYCYARPKEENVLEWHFILRGPPDTPFYGGEYWGQLLFPPEYPFRPPGIKVSTPSGRFHTDTKICTSMSDFHPGSWNPAWSVANILVGLLSFMCSDEMTTGSVLTTNADRQALAKRSHAFNIAQARFKRIFPDFCTAEGKDLPNMGEHAQSSGSGGSGHAGQASTIASTATGKSLTSEEIHLARRRQGTEHHNNNAISPDHHRHLHLSASMKSNRDFSNALQSAAAASTSGSVQQQAAQPVRQVEQTKSRSIFHILIAVVAYLFLSRLLSTIGSGGIDGGSTSVGA